MKKLFAFALVAISMLAVSCKKESETKPLTVSEEEVIIWGFEPASTTITVTSTNKWIATYDADWLSLNETTGSGEVEITISVTKASVAFREANVVFTDLVNGDNVTVPVKQGEHYTLDQVNAVDCYYMDFGLPYFMFDLYVSDPARNDFSHNLDICFFAYLDDAEKIAGEWEFDNEEEASYISNEGVKTVFKSGTFKIKCLRAMTDPEVGGVYSFSIDAVTEKDEAWKQTWTVRTLAADEELEYYLLTDTAE